MKQAVSSIYKAITAELAKRDILGTDFDPMTKIGEQPELLQAKGMEEGVSWAPGAYDGVLLYHAGIAAYEATEEEEAQIAAAMEAILAGDRETFEKRVEELTAPIVGIVGNILSYFVENAEGESFLRAVKCAREVMTKSRSIPSIKFVLALVSVVDFSDDEEAVTVFRNLSRYEEFTDYCLYSFLAWQNGDYINEVFETARHTVGWGRIHALSALAALPYHPAEVKEWVFRNGVDNDILPSYAAEPTFIVARVDKRMKEPLSEEDYACVVKILTALFSEPVYGAANLDDYVTTDGVVSIRDTELAREAMALAERYPKTEAVREMLESIRDYFADEEEGGVIAEKCRELLAGL